MLSLTLLLYLCCRWNSWKVPGVGWCRPAHIRYFLLCSAAPQDPPGESGAQRYSMSIVVFHFLFSSLHQTSKRVTVNACQLPLCETCQRSQAVSLAGKSTLSTNRSFDHHQTIFSPLLAYSRSQSNSVLVGHLELLLCIFNSLSSSTAGIIVCLCCIFKSYSLRMELCQLLSH